MLEGNNGSAGAPDGKTWFFLRSRINKTKFKVQGALEKKK